MLINQNSKKFEDETIDQNKSFDINNTQLINPNNTLNNSCLSVNRSIEKSRSFWDFNTFKKSRLSNNPQRSRSSNNNTIVTANQKVTEKINFKTNLKPSKSDNDIKNNDNVHVYSNLDKSSNESNLILDNAKKFKFQKVNVEEEEFIHFNYEGDENIFNNKKERTNLKIKSNNVNKGNNISNNKVKIIEEKKIYIDDTSSKNSKVSESRKKMLEKSIKDIPLNKGLKSTVSNNKKLLNTSGSKSKSPNKK